MAKLLIVDDEEMIRVLIRKYAQYDGFEVDEADDGEQAVYKCSTNTYDCIIMDIMMKHMDGYTAVKKIRENSDTPVIMLSAKGEEIDRIHGFECGIDDYVMKPFSAKELMMRVHAILKRVNKKEQKIFTYKDLKINFSARTVFIRNEEIHLSPKEYDLLFYLVNNKGIAISRDRCLSEIWGYDFYGDDRTLDTHVKTLRKNLMEYSDCIVTVRGVGYRFETK